MCLSVTSYQPCTIYCKNYMEILDTDIMDNLIECPLQKRRIHSHHRLQSSRRKPRSKGDRMGEFKAGAFRIASKVGADIVPVAIDGSYIIMEAYGGLMKPAHVNVTILPPVSTAGMDRAALKQLPGQVAGLIAAAKQPG